MANRNQEDKRDRGYERFISSLNNAPKSHVLKYIHHIDPEVRRQAINTLALSRGPDVVNVLVAATGDPIWSVRLTAVLALKYFEGMVESVTLIHVMQNDSNSVVRHGSVEALKARYDDEVVFSLFKVAGSVNEETWVKCEAVKAISLLQGKDYTKMLCMLTVTGCVDVRMAALSAIACRNDEADFTIRYLLSAIEDPDIVVSSMAHEILQKKAPHVNFFQIGSGVLKAGHRL